MPIVQQILLLPLALFAWAAGMAVFGPLVIYMRGLSRPSRRR
jgi:hypothetical protein